ncbi:MAG TPA: M3 family metallopeptidase, partial [Candidatus Eisenbacteria bacterium]
MLVTGKWRTAVHRSRRILLVALAAAALAAPVRAEPPAAAADGFFYRPDGGAAGFRARSDSSLSSARGALGRLLAATGPRTIANTLVPYNLAVLHADNAAGEGQLLEETSPDSAYRATAALVKRDAIQFLTELSLNRDAYNALNAVDVSGADAATRYFLQRTLRDFRLAGVDRDEAARKKIAALNDSIVAIGQEFERNIRDDSRTIRVAPEELAGLPEDFVKAHPPGTDGMVSLSIEYPDYFPVMNYCKSESVRKRLFLASGNRAYPQNMAVLDRLLERRHELAGLLGHESWADYITADKMIGTERKAAAFIQRLNDLTLKAGRAEYETYLKRKREDDPSAQAVNIWERRYYGDLIRKRDYDFDARQARPYFPFEGVKQGVLDATSRLFGVTYRRLAGIPVWDPSVEAYEMYEGDRLLGRFYLDLHPRPNKFNHAANFPIHGGASGVQLPQGALVCNFPRGNARRSRPHGAQRCRDVLPRVRPPAPLDHRGAAGVGAPLRGGDRARFRRGPLAVPRGVRMESGRPSHLREERRGRARSGRSGPPDATCRRVRPGRLQLLPSAVRRDLFGPLQPRPQGAR